MAAPPFSTLTAPKTPLPKATPQAGSTGSDANPHNSFWRQRTATGQAEGDPRVTGDPGLSTGAIHQNQIGSAGADKVATVRQRLVAAGYDVAPTGAGTPRLEKAYAHFIATKGGGAKVWNAHNLQITHPAPVAGSRVPVTSPAAKTPPGFVPAGNGVPLQTDQVPGETHLPQFLQAQLNKEFAPYSGDQGQPTIIDPVKLAAQQADMQYGSQISQSKDDINQMLGAEPGAQANITKYFQPAKDQAAANVSSDDAASAANVAAQAKISPGLAAALGLSGATAGTANAVGTAGTDLASNLGAITHADDVAAQGAADRREQEAHSVEASNNTIGLNSARQQLLQQLATKGQAQNVDEATNRQQNFSNRTQGIANKGEIQNINATAGLAKTNIVKGILENGTIGQGQAIAKSNNDINVARTKSQLKSDAINQKYQLEQTKRLTLAVNPKDPNKPTKIPFGMVQGGDREKIEAAIWGTLQNLPPDKALREGNNLITGFYGWNSTPASRAFIQSVIQKHQWDPKDKKYKA